MNPDKQNFIERIAEKFDDSMTLSTRQVVVEQIYNILFDAKLSQLTATQLSLLSILLHSEKPEESTQVLETISGMFPETIDYITNLYKNKDLLPK